VSPKKAVAKKPVAKIAVEEVGPGLLPARCDVSVA
jgi:hypothetical protein